jgi:hypothetical protein
MRNVWPPDRVIWTAPLLPVVEYHDIDFDNAFNSTSIYRGPPVREREEAWERLTYSMQAFTGRCRFVSNGIKI